MCSVCASDVGVWRGHNPKKFPYSPGHEFCGRVEQLGPGVTQFRTGQTVIIDPNLGCGECRYCRAQRPNLCDSLKSRAIKSNGGFAEYVSLDVRMVHAMPDGMSESLATFVEPFSCALHVVRRAEEVEPRRAAVFGAGMLGMLTSLLLNKPGRETIIIEPDDARREQAQTLLGIRGLTPQQLTNSEWFGTLDAAIDCTGRVEAVAQATRALAKAGRLVLAGLVGNPQDAALPFVEITIKELEIVGAWLNPHTFEDAIPLVMKHRETLQALRTEVFPLDEIEAAFTRAAKPNVNKVFVKP
jgi:L-iditol 2-dehydrogenase